MATAVGKKRGTRESKTEREQKRERAIQKRSATTAWIQCEFKSEVECQNLCLLVQLYSMWEHNVIQADDLVDGSFLCVKENRAETKGRESW